MSDFIFNKKHALNIFYAFMRLTVALFFLLYDSLNTVVLQDIDS